jgi:hypothetical protein
MGDRRQVDAPHTVAEVGRDARSDLDGETRLAGTTGTRQRHQATVCQQLAYLGYLRAAADKAGQLHRKILRINTFERTQGRKFVADIGVAQLHDPLRARKIAQLMGAQVSQPSIDRQPVHHQLLSRAGQHSLATMRQIAQPRRPVDGRPGVVAFVPQLHLAGMHADA